MKRLNKFIGSLLVLLALPVSAETPVEVKLIAAFEEDRGYCLDLRGGQTNGQPIGGLHGHTCYTYERGTPSPDQGFVMENIRENNEFRMVEFSDKCMTLYEPQAGSFISIETCDGRDTQKMMLEETGQIIPEMMPELCLTIGDVVIPGGGGDPLHIMRDVTFESCDSAISDRQLWELRAEWAGPDETTAERPYAVNPNGAMAMGMGMGMGMGAAPPPQ